MQDNLLVCIRNSVSPEMYEDLNKRIKILKEEAASWRELYLQKASDLYNSDVMVQNQQQALKHTRQLLENYEEENGHLKALLVKSWK